MPGHGSAVGPEEPKKVYEEVVHPDHYNKLPVECIDVIRHFSGSFALAMKHIWRAGLKPDDPMLLDIRKAVFYLVHEYDALRPGSEPLELSEFWSPKE